MMMLMPKRHSALDLFEDMFNDPFFTGRSNNSLMKSDIKETEKEYLIDVDLPGYDKKDIKLSIENGYLTISASTNAENDNSTHNFIHKERYYGECQRSFYVGDEIKEDDVKAQFKNGTLNLSIPKKELTNNSTRKYITIN